MSFSYIRCREVSSTLSSTRIDMSVFIFRFVAYAIVALAGAVLLSVLKHRFRQRSLLKIPGPSNPSLFWGHWRHFFNHDAYQFHETIYRTYGKVARIYGFFGDIQLVVSDPKACNNIVIKDHLIFEQTETVCHWNRHAFGTGLLATSGAQHRKQRKLLNPVFNVNQMRYMSPIFHGVTRQLCESLDSLVAHGPHEINLVPWVSKLALKLIGQASLGYSFGTFEGRNNEFLSAMKQWGPVGHYLKVHRNLFPHVSKIFPPKILKFVGKMLPWPSLNHLMDLAEILNVHARDIYETRKRLLESGDDATIKQIGNDKDIISLLMRANATASEDDQLSEEEIVAQVMILTQAATATTSATLSRVLHLLSLRPDVQNKLREELRDACQGNEELAHDHLVSLPFLEAVCRETLRLYPPFAGVMRTALSDIVLPLSAPICDVDGRKIHEVFVPKDTNVYIHIYNLNRDPSIWGPDVTEWKPERWLAPLPESVREAHIQGVYANMMTFIGGPRACIGFQFAQLEIKVALSQMVLAFRFEPTGAEVAWLFDTVTNPSVKGSPSVPMLPVLVSRHKNSP
ncbi:cytochrome P450 [Lactarius akahatsu]|uniref:Cytochrome P450 n=1 Tax=Lactarius akahatsu TaxID=416441 RepID=A0AAD4L920_9AGAM|nr:cytochrome P450 [Lactarius akahatsu]